MSECASGVRARTWANPNPLLVGDKDMSQRAPVCAKPVATAVRLAAWYRHHRLHALAVCCRWRKAELGTSNAMPATAYKVGWVIYTTLQ